MLFRAGQNAIVAPTAWDAGIDEPKIKKLILQRRICPGDRIAPLEYISDTQIFQDQVQGFFTINPDFSH